jgi:hypothetical protein
MEYEPTLLVSPNTITLVRVYVLLMRGRSSRQRTLLTAEPTPQNPNPEPILVSNAQLYSLVADVVSELL